MVSISLGSAYTSSATGALRGGQGAGAISGYVVSHVSFGLGAAGTADSVRFRVTPANAISVRVQVVAAGPWLGCLVGDGEVHCTLPSGTAASAVDQLSVLAT